MISSNVKYRTAGVLVILSSFLSVASIYDPLFAQESNQTAGNQTGEAMQAAGNQTVGALQTVGNRTGEAFQGIANETGEAFQGVQEFFNEGGENQTN